MKTDTKTEEGSAFDITTYLVDIERAHHQRTKDLLKIARIRYDRKMSGYDILWKAFKNMASHLPKEKADELLAEHAIQYAVGMTLHEWDSYGQNLAVVLSAQTGTICNAAWQGLEAEGSGFIKSAVINVGCMGYDDPFLMAENKLEEYKAYAEAFRRLAVEAEKSGLPYVSNLNALNSWAQQRAQKVSS